MKPLVGFALFCCFALTLAQVSAQGGDKDKGKDDKKPPVEFKPLAFVYVPETLSLRPGETKLLTLVIAKNKKIGEVTVTIEGLPEGVTAEPPVLKVPKEKTVAPFTLKVAPNAKDIEKKEVTVTVQGDGLKDARTMKVTIATPPPPLVVGSVELIDGSTLSCEFPQLVDKVLKKFENPKEKTVEKFVEVQVPPTVSIEVDELGVATLPLSKVRLVDFQGKRQRVVTHSGDTIMGTIVSPGFVVRPITAGGAPFQLKSERISRISFPEPPPF